MGNKQSQERSLDQFINNPQFTQSRQGIYTGNSDLAAYPSGGSYLDSNNKKNIQIQTQTTQAIKNDFTIDKNSVSLIPHNDPTIFYLSFKFSSTTDVEISVFYHGKDMTDPNQNTQYIYVDTNKYPPIKSFIFGPVKDQEFPAYASMIDTRTYTKDTLLKVSDGTYPLIIKMETKVDQIDLPKKILYNYFSFRSSGGKYEGRFLKQKLEINGTSFILDDVFGIAKSDLGSHQEKNECTICLTNPIDTVVLPCKHMCLCVGCAKNLLDRHNSQCPVCRTNVENYLMLKNN